MTDLTTIIALALTTVIAVAATLAVVWLNDRLDERAEREALRRFEVFKQREDIHE